MESSFTYQVRKLNYELMGLAKQHANFFICDIAGLQNKFGRDFMFASNVYVSTEMVLSVDALPYVASRVMDIICSVRGQFKKCLILDLDNYLCFQRTYASHLRYLAPKGEQVLRHAPFHDKSPCLFDHLDRRHLYSN